MVLPLVNNRKRNTLRAASREASFIRGMEFIPLGDFFGEKENRETPRPTPRGSSTADLLGRCLRLENDEPNERKIQRNGSDVQRAFVNRRASRNERWQDLGAVAIEN